MNPLKHTLSTFISLFLLISTPIKADITIGAGSAEIFNNNEKQARNQAINNALRDVVKKETALLLNPIAIMRHRAAIQEQIHNKAPDFIKSYEIVNDELSNKVARIQIKADVASDAVKQKLSQLYILQSKIDYKRLIVIYKARHPKSLPPKNIAVYSALNAIPLEFKQSVFLITSRDPANTRDTPAMEDKIMESCLKYLYGAYLPGNTKENCENIQDKRQLDALMEFEIIPGKEEIFPESMFSYAKAAVRMRTYDLSSLELVSNVESKQRQLTDASEGTANWSNAVSRAAEKSARIAAMETMSNMLERYKNTGNISNTFLLIFKKISEKNKEVVIKLLEGVEGYQSMLPSQSSSRFKIQYVSNLGKQRLAVKILLKLKKLGLAPKYRSLSGNRLLFRNI